MDPARYVVELESAVSLMAQAVTEADLDAQVPTCPGWTVRDLVEHVGTVHLWAAQAARTGARPDPFPACEPAERTLPQWYADCAQELVETLTGLDPAEPCWTFSRDDRTVRFWNRRQLHETTIHWVDVLLASGQPLPGSPELTSEVADDGVDELLGFFLPRQLHLQRMPQAMLSAPVAVRAIDTGHRWLVQPAEAGVRVTRDEAAGPGDQSDGTDHAGRSAVAEVSGSAPELYLALWKRADDSAFDLAGDAVVARAFLDAALAP